MINPKNKKIKLIIFDMDGTILDTLSDITNSVNYTFKSFNYNLVTSTQVRKALGNGGRRLIADLLINEKVNNLDEVVNFYLNYYSKNNNILTKPYEGIIELLNTLKKQYKLAVVSNKSDHLVKLLNEQIFNGIFDLSIGEQKGLKIKPDPAMLNYVMKHFNYSQDETIFIGDSEVDIKTAKNANLEVIAVTWGFRDYDELITYKPNHLIKNPNEIINILK